MKIISILIFTISTGKLLSAQPYRISNPDSLKIITTDITNFWKTFDKLSTVHNFNDTVEIIQKYYLDQASYGLQEYLKASNSNSIDFAKAIKIHKNYLLSIRKTTTSILNYKYKIIDAAKKLKSMYQAASFPQIYFVMGKFEVAGTQFKNFIYIGAELMCASSTSALNKIGRNLRPMISPLNNIATVCIHEITHYQQEFQDAKNIMDGALIEGAADFITKQITGKTTAQSCFAYGYKHEKELRLAFKSEDTSRNFIKWFVNIPDTLHQRPGMLGYFIGYRICEVYYRKSANKAASLKDIIVMKIPSEIYEKSKYFSETKTATHN